MNKFNIKKIESLLAVLLVFVMIVGILPVTVFAENNNNIDVFTIGVKDSNGTAVNDAEVTYTIKDGDSIVESAKGKTDIDGQISITEIAKYSNKITNVDGSTITISYSISKEGYTTTVAENVKVLEVNGYINVLLTTNDNSKAKLSIIQNGSGEIKINGTKVEDSYTTIEKGTETKLEITPINGDSGVTYIQSLKIGTEVINVNKGQSYINDKFIITENTEIIVDFITEFTITASAYNGGTVKLNGNNSDSININKGDNLNIEVTPNSGYQIETVSINGENQEVIDISTFSKEIIVEKEMIITATFIKLYTITVTYDHEKGTVITSPEGIGGKIHVTEGKDIHIKATPNSTYRVAKVLKNGVSEEFNENNKEYEDTITNVDKDYSYEITFSPNTYKVTSAETTKGKVSIENPLVDYGQTTKIKLTPESDSYRIGEIKIKTDSNPEGIVIDKTLDSDYIEESDGSATYTLKNITENIEIKATFEDIPVVDGDWDKKVSITATGGSLINSYKDKDDNKVYVYSKGAVVSIKALPIYDRVNIKLQGKPIYEGWKSERIISSSATIEAIKVKTIGKSNEEIINLNNKKIIIVWDKTAPEVTITPDNPNSNNYYNKDVKVGISASDPDYYSGIKEVEYWVLNGETITQHEVLNGNNEAIYNNEITVDSSINNSDNVKVRVKVTDVSGNEKTVEKELRINITKPIISISIDGSLHSEAESGYYNSDRKATIEIVDRAGTFDETAVFNGLNITAKDAQGNHINVSKAAMLGKWEHTGDTHKVTLTFREDGNYNWSLSYTNKADLIAENAVISGDSVYNFTVDKRAPKASIKLDTTIWNKLIDKLTFGIWKNYSVSVEAAGEDLISPLYDVKYYKSNSTTALSENELIELYNDNKFVTEKYTVNPDEQFAVYARITDYAGNTSYISTDGVIVDNTPSNITLTPDKANESGLYNKDVNVDIEINDEVFNGKAYSGINTVSYVVESKGKITQEGTLYTFDKKNPTQDELTKSWTGSIKVDSSKNNDDDVKVTVISYDNSGMKSEESINVSINIDRPIVNVSFSDTANKIENNRGYFGKDRIATIEIIDRPSSFNAEAATKGFTINAVDANGKKVDLDTDKILSSWSSNGDRHTATITFSEDGNYTWSFNYTNKAINSMEGIKATGTTPFDFTVDKTNPTGTLSINESTWDRLLRIITFGLYSNKKVQVKATAEDATSPVVIEYYKTNNPIAMTAKELNDVTFKPYSDFALEGNEQFIIYLKISDYAGNFIYISSNGFIVDKEKSDIIITPEEANKNNSYNKDVKISIKVIDEEPYSGIKTIDYWVIKDSNNDKPTEEGNLYTFTNTNPTQEELIKEWNGNLIVDAKKNNSSNVRVYIRTVDNAGNENIKSIPLDIDITAPKVKVAYDNNKDNKGNTYFNEKRIATITITERTNHFDEKEATEGIVITATDSKGNKVLIDNWKIISNWTTVKGDNPDLDTHTAKIQYLADANYTFKISYVDKAGNVNGPVDTGNSVAPYKFTVDKNAPTGTIKAVSEEGREEIWSELVDSLTFGFWSGKKITLTSTSEDATSPIESVEYYKIDAKEAISEAELKKITNWKNFNELSVVPNEQFTVYLKITDKSGNIKYISSDGMIADNVSPAEERIAPEVTVTPQQPINGIYNRDVKVTIKVDDPLVGDTYSGLKTVSYRVLNMGQETQSGTLYSFAKSNPKHNELLKTWTGEIIVDSAKNNSNDVVIEVYAEDNSLNSSKNKVPIKIDTTAPSIFIKYNNNKAENQKYYNENRVATVVITERNFNPKDVKISITNTDGVMPSISEWKQSAGSGNGDNTTHTATINYNVDGDYTFKIEYTDLAGNKSGGESYEAGTTNPKEFTIDKTLPEISVNYDNNRASNGKYFNENRTSTIVVKEHNFDVSRVEISQTASKNGTTIAVPSANWSSNGDIHTATINYNADGDYTFSIKMSDMAGNNSGEANYGGAIAAEEFTIDTDISEPEITGVENGKAYKDDVIPGISFSDINYSSHQVTLTRTDVTEKDVDVTEEFIKNLNLNAQGASGVNDTFEKDQENDGIYTLYVKVNDKAGNESEKTVKFTVNRFGSVYEYNDYLISLISNGGAYVQSIDDDLLITEYNADRLLEDSLTIDITRDGRPIENREYDVSTAINNEVQVGDSGWFQYQYTISKENFAEDGLYKMSISSKDATGNTPENTNYKDKSILFRVDSTAPELTSIVGLEKNIINSQELTVNYTVFDTIALKSIKVFVNDKQQGDEITDFSADMNNYSGSFVINESNSEQKVRIIIEDMAGNITDTNSEDFTSAYIFEKAVTVSTNTLVRWYANKVIFWSSTIGTLVVAGGILYTIYGKKKIKIK